jgi:hypothetical protein
MPITQARVLALVQAYEEALERHGALVGQLNWLASCYPPGATPEQLRELALEVNRLGQLEHPAAAPAVVFEKAWFQRFGRSNDLARERKAQQRMSSRSGTGPMQGLEDDGPGLLEGLL